MKNVTLLLLVLLLVFSFAACSDEADQNIDNTAAPTRSESTPTTPPPATGSSRDHVIQIPARDIYFTSPVDWTVDKDTFAIMLYENKDCMVAIGYDWLSNFEGEYGEMITCLGERIISEASSKCRGYISNSNLEIVSSGMCKLADYECMKFLGKIDNDGKWYCYVCGYAYEVDGVNLVVLGIVSAPEQEPAMIEMIETLTDQIANSVRTEK